MPTVQIDGQPIHYGDTGGDGPAVIFSHSFGMDGSMFAPQLEAFAPEYRCITWDERAHGASPAAANFSFWDSARDCLGLLDALGLESAVLVGTSQGGFLALRAAMLAPDRVRGAAVLGTSAAAEEAQQKIGFQQLHDAFVSGGANGPPEAVLDAMASISLGDRFDVEPWKAKWRKWPAEQFSYAFKALVDRDDITARLGEVRVPVLVMHGSDDRSYATSYGKTIAAGVPHSEGYVEVEGGSHFLSITDPVPVNAALETFFARHASVAGAASDRAAVR
jgi:pimeloyl-ACP methyl ester carboxylesterase